MGPTCTLCVIDDIRSVVDGIAKHIPWASHRIEVCGTALDGDEGIRMIRTMKPDIVLTDIRMPNMDGIEMLKTLREEAFQGKVIFFSGYNDFEYVQQALRLGAFDYITKPHSVQSIIDVVLKAKKAVEEERLAERKAEEIRLKLRMSLPILRQELFHLLLHHPASEEHIRRRWEFLQVELSPVDLAVMAIEIDHFAERSRSLSIEEAELVRFTMHNIVEETMARHTNGYIFRESSSRFIAIYNTVDSLEPTSIAELCRENIAAFTKLTVSIGLGRKAASAIQLREAYREANFALSYQFYAGGNAVLLYDDVANSDTGLPSYSKDKEQELAMCLLSGNAPKACNVLESIFAELSAGPKLPEPMLLISVYYELASVIVRILLEKVPYREIEPIERKFRDGQWISVVPHVELQQTLLELCKEGCRSIESRQNSETERRIEESIRYIRANLHADLSIGECAKHIHVSANYFVHLFKKVTGRTFVQYVTQERIEKAKTMLAAGHQVQDIAAAVGYEDRRYFSEVFKKSVGMTPSEYKERNL